MKLVYGLFGILFLSGCSALSVNTGVNSYASNQFDPKLTHMLAPQDKSQEGSLQFEEISLQASRALSKSGINVNNENKQADVVVLLDYAVSEPKTKTEVVSRPIYGQTGVSSSYTSGSVSNIGGFGSYSGHTAYIPTYGVVGYNNVPVTTTSYVTTIALTAYDYKKFNKSKEAKELWKTQIASVGPSSDLRRLVPYMLKAGIPYYGKSTGEVVFAEIKEDDQEAMYIRTGTLDTDGKDADQNQFIWN